jgi:hypothetical protein
MTRDMKDRKPKQSTVEACRRLKYQRPRQCVMLFVGRDGERSLFINGVRIEPPILSDEVPNWNDLPTTWYAPGWPIPGTVVTIIGPKGCCGFPLDNDGESGT